jgi:hypothetical protein
MSLELFWPQQQTTTPCRHHRRVRPTDAAVCFRMYFNSLNLLYTYNLIRVARNDSMANFYSRKGRDPKQPKSQGETPWKIHEQTITRKITAKAMWIPVNRTRNVKNRIPIWDVISASMSQGKPMVVHGFGYPTNNNDAWMQHQGL